MLRPKTLAAAVLRVSVAEQWFVTPQQATYPDLSIMHPKMPEGRELLPRSRKPSAIETSECSYRVARWAGLPSVPASPIEGARPSY